MALYREKLESNGLKSNGVRRRRKWAKNQMNRFMRRKPIEEDDHGYKSAKKPTKFWEY